jgi:hypothetical protein
MLHPTERAANFRSDAASVKRDKSNIKQRDRRVTSQRRILNQKRVEIAKRNKVPKEDESTLSGLDAQVASIKFTNGGSG